MHHVVLLGDSIFDNASYVGGGPDVIRQLREALPPPWRATLLAVDGATIADVPRQLARVPDDSSDIVLSVGGNDALQHLDLLDRRASSSAQVLRWFSEATDAFEMRYRALLRHIADLQHDRHVLVCTIYNGNLGAGMERAAAAAIRMFDDAIGRAARERHWPVIELRDLFTEAADYANPIEPSVRGGVKLARAISEQVRRVSDSYPERRSQRARPDMQSGEQPMP